jgi:glycosyltransferase involved in cell wall biosynthesis
MAGIKWGKVKKIVQHAPQDGWRMGRRLLGLSNQPGLAYFVPNANWATDWVGRYVVQAASSAGLMAFTTNTPQLSSDYLLHYADLGSFLYFAGHPHNRRNRLVATVFHGYLEGENKQLVNNIEKFIAASNQLEAVVTASCMMQDRLTSWLPSHLPVYRLPIGVDVTKFRPVSQDEKAILRAKLGVPSDAFCIGSFQKDGVGWSTGTEPKLIKGPDVFIEVIAQLRTRIPNLFVILTAPARGYVIDGLKKCGVPYIHHILDNYLDITHYYQILDCYLVASREEGGPKAILESMATGIPLVTTEVGMAPDLVINGYNGRLCRVEDIAALSAAIEQVYANPGLAQQMVKAGVKTANDYDWVRIGNHYVEQVYRPLLAKI